MGVDSAGFNGLLNRAVDLVRVSAGSKVAVDPMLVEIGKEQTNFMGSEVLDPKLTNARRINHVTATIQRYEFRPRRRVPSLSRCLGNRTCFQLQPRLNGIE